MLDTHEVDERGVYQRRFERSCFANQSAANVYTHVANTQICTKHNLHTLTKYTAVKCIGVHNIYIYRQASR